MTQAEVLRDLAERLAECNGAVRLVSTVMTTAAAAAMELCETADTGHAPLPQRPEAVPVRYVAHIEAGSFTVTPVRGEALAFTETQAAADRIVAALNLLAAVEEQENGNAAVQG